MSGGLMQLVAYGAQDIYLTGNPEISFFKLVYHRYTNFALESIEQTFSGQIDFGRRVQATISRNGDLIWKTYLQLDLPTLTGTGTQAWVRNIGNVIINNTYIEIGGQQIDKHYGQFMAIWQELTLTAEHQDGYNVMIGNTAALTTEAASIPGQTLYIPLQFWYCKNIGVSLPLIALQYHEVKITVELRSFADCYVSSSGTVTTPSIGYASLWVDYVYLDTDERRRFAQISHEYLIDQLQFTGTESFAQTAVKQRLNFNHPCKELIWVSQLDANVQPVSSAGALANRWTDFTDNGLGANPYNGNDPLQDAKLQLNGHDRFQTRFGSYFNLVQNYQHHTRIPAVGIYTYSFAIKPEEHQPSGTCNFSRIDNATLQLDMTSSGSMKLYTYAVNYNILRIMSGMGGLAYSS
jgi:hypothetical protein